MNAFLKIFIVLLILGLVYLFLRRRHRSRPQKPHDKFRIPDPGQDE